MKKQLQLLLLFFLFYSCINRSYAQLIISAPTTGQALAQSLVGQGVTISNVTFTGAPEMAGFFINLGGTNLGIDSGIILTNGRAKTVPDIAGVDGDGVIQAGNVIVDNSWDLPGDPDLSALSFKPTTDACVLEFDFVPLGDSIKVNYVFASEEFNKEFICYFEDIFAFFISGPGITGKQNIALIPNTTTPVSSFNVNDVLNEDGHDCRSNTAYYVDNLTNTLWNYDGHTAVFTAGAKVQPCQTYHLKLAIADEGGDTNDDSGVFLETHSLNSNPIQLINLSPTDPVTNNKYIVEGCTTGIVKVKREYATTAPETVNLSYAGTALNTIDVQTLPAAVTIPANQTEVTLNILPVIDNIPEGIELLKIYALSTVAACSSASPVPIDSAIIEVRDYDTLGVVPDTMNICRNTAVQLIASAGYLSYVWDVNATLSNTVIRNPLALPVSNETTYYCTATIGNCHARDSAYIRWKDLELLSKTNINCANGNTGQIHIGAGPEWQKPLLFSINNAAYQTDSSFTNLPIGNYTIKIKDASGCIDSIQQNLIQAFPNLTASTAPGATDCLNNTAKITVSASGGSPSYQYSIDNGMNYQSSTDFIVTKGSYPILVKDNNGCIANTSGTVIFTDNLLLNAGTAAIICEGSNTKLNATSNAVSYIWAPAATLTNSNTASPTATPATTTKYYVTATRGVCEKIDSVMVNVNPAPIANAGSNINICFGGSTNLDGSGGVEYTWKPATYLSDPGLANTKVNKPTNNITYSLSVKDSKGCPSLKPDTVDVTVTPAVKISAGPDIATAINEPTKLKVAELSSSGVISYTWSPDFGLNDPGIATPTATLSADMTYIVTGKTATDCEGSDTISIKVYKGPEIYVPTAFTPNGDNINDILRPIAIGMKENHYFTVFNRYGQKVFSTSDFTKGWDGKLQGVMQNTGTYIWMAEAVDFRGNLFKKSGSTILIR